MKVCRLLHDWSIQFFRQELLTESKYSASQIYIHPKCQPFFFPLFLFLQSGHNLNIRTLKNLLVTVVQAQYKWKMEMSWYWFLTVLFFTTILVFCHSRNVNFQLRLVRNGGKRKVVSQKANNYNKLPYLLRTRPLSWAWPTWFTLWRREELHRGRIDSLMMKKVTLPRMIKDGSFTTIVQQICFYLLPTKSHRFLSSKV